MVADKEEASVIYLERSFRGNKYFYGLLRNNHISVRNQPRNRSKAFHFLKLTVLSICSKPSRVLFGLMSYKRRGRKGRLFIKAQKSREMRSAVHKTSYAELSVLLSQGGGSE